MATWAFLILHICYKPATNNLGCLFRFFINLFLDFLKQEVLGLQAGFGFGR